MLTNDLHKVQPERDRLAILVMDSGLGGLSIYAAIEAGLRRRCPCRETVLTYFNAWPEQARGYNSMADTAERVAAFERALAAAAAFKPDMLLIACNTLSVLYPHTRFARAADIAVTGIIDLGVDLIQSRMAAVPGSRCIIFGTLTTIEADVHRRALRDRGMQSHRLGAQACDQLATAIESGPHSQAVQRMIAHCVDQGVNDLSPTGGPVYAALCCTHFGYSALHFQQALDRRLGSAAGGVIDPNTAMVDQALSRVSGPAYPDAAIHLNVVSKIKWPPEKIDAMAAAVRPISAPVAEALIHYHHQPELF